MFNSIRLFEFVPTQRAWTLCGTVGEGIVPKAHLDFVRDAATSQTRLVVIEEDSGASLTDHIVTADARLEPSVSGEQAWVFLVHNDAVPSPIPSHLREGSSGDRVFAVHFASASDAARFAKQHRAACLLARMSGSPAAAPDAGRAVTCSIGAGATHGCEVPTAVLQAVEGSAWLAERSANQDAFAIGNGVTLGRSAVFAIFDGHGPHGARVAESLQRRIVGDVRSTCSEEEADERVSAALRALVEAAQQRLEHEFGSALAESGCSALIVVATGATLTVAHTGGCQLLLVAGGRGTADALRYSSYSSTPSATALTASHSPAHPSERRRIEAAGGVVSSIDPRRTAAHPTCAVQRNASSVAHSDENARVWCPRSTGPGLPLSRSIGDLTAHRRCGVVATPEILQRTISPEDRFLVLISSGVHRVLSHLGIASTVTKSADAWHVGRGFSTDDNLSVAEAEALAQHCANALCKATRVAWRERHGFVDDTTAIVVPIC